MLFKFSALKDAIVKDDFEQVKHLLTNHPELASKRNASKALALALAMASDEVVLALSDAGWNLLEKNWSSRTGLEEAVFCGRQVVITAWMERYRLLWSEDDKARLLNISIEKNDIPTLRFLLESGISDPEAIYGYYAPLNIALQMRNAEAVLLLRSMMGEDAPTVGADVPKDNSTSSLPVLPSAQWHMVDDTTVIRVREQAAAGYRLTDIFNFALGTCISVQRNLETNSETAVTLDLTAAASQTAAQEAHAQLERAGGKPPALPQPAPLLRKGAG